MRIFVQLLIVATFSLSLNGSDAYELAIESMVYNKDIKNAYKLSKKLVKKSPGNITYRKWAAKLALWNGDSKEALREYYRLYKMTGKESFAKEALKLSLGLGEYDVSIDILQNRLKKGADRESLKLLVDMLEYRGDLDEAIDILEKKSYLYDKKSYYEKLFELYMLAQRPKDVERIGGIYLKEYGKLPTKVALYLSKHYLGKGKVKRSYETLLKADSESDYYLQRVVEFSIYMQDRDRLKRSLEELLSRGIESEWYYANLIKLYIEDGRYSKALQLAKRGVLKYRTSSMFYLYSRALNRTKEWREEEAFLNGLKDTEISKSPYYWAILARLYTLSKKFDKAKEAYSEALGIAGYEKEFVDGYIWLLIDTKDIDGLKRALRDPNIKEEMDERLLLAAYISTKEDEKALRILQPLVEREPKNYNLLLLYSDMLYTVGRFQESKKRRFEAYTIMRGIYSKNRDSIKNREFLQDYLRLSFYYEPYSKIEKLLEYAESRYPDSFYKSAYLNFTLMNGRYDTARFYLNRLKVSR